MNPAGPLPAAPGSFAEKYASVPDPLNGTYNEFMAPFHADSQVQPATLRDLVINASDQLPKVYACCTGTPPQVEILLEPNKFAPTMGLPCQWDNQIFVLCGDVGAGNQYTMVHWPETAFARTPAVRVPAPEQVTAAWTAANGADCLGPFDAAAADTVEARTRMMMPIPPDYAPQAVIRGVYTLQQFRTDMIDLIIADGREVACAPLITWSTVSSTFRPADANGNPQPPATHITLETPRSDATLRDRSWQWVCTSLPSLRERGGTATQAFTATMSAMTQEFQQRRTEERDRADAASAPKTPRQKFPELIDGLMRMTEVQNENNLPQAYKTIAASSKAGGIQALQALANNRAAEADSSRQPPIITPALFERFKSGTFSSSSPDDLTSGLSMFLMVALGYTGAATALEKQTVYATIYSGGGAPNIEQVLQLTTGAPVMVQTSYGLLVVYKSYSVTLDLALGVPHRVAVYFRSVFLPSLERLLPTLELYFGPQLFMILPRLLRHTQLAMEAYFDAAATTGNQTPLPDLLELCRIIQMRNFQQLPNLPPSYMAPTPPTIPPIVPSVPGGGPTPGGGGPTPGGGNPQDASRVTNPNAVQALVNRWAAFDAVAGNPPLRRLTAQFATAIPNMDSGEAMCLSWHIRGACNSNCGRKSSHHLATEQETARANAFMDAAGVPAL